MGKVVDETGNKYDRLTVIKRAENDRNRKACWFCVCTCGGEKIVDGGSLRAGGVRSCGCLNRENLGQPSMIGKEYIPIIKDMVKERNMSQTEIAEELEVTEASVQLFAKNHNISNLYILSRRTIEEKFWDNVNDCECPWDIVNSIERCWLWTGTVSDGRGTLAHGTKHLHAQRIAWELEHGTVPDGQYVLRNCRNLLCVNPHHMFLSNKCREYSNDILTLQKEQLEEELFVRGSSIVAIAKKYDCHPRTVQERLTTLNIELDPHIWKGGVSTELRLLLLRGYVLTEEQEHILVGSMLGDGNLSRHGNEEAAFRFGQCSARSGYVEWMRIQLHPFTKSGPVKFNPNSKSVYFTSFHHPEFTKWYEHFYPSGKKIVPANIMELLNKQSLAVWFMEDGHTYKGKSRSAFCTHGFTIQGVELLLEALSELFNIKGTYRLVKKKYPVLEVTCEANEILHDLIDPLLHEDFEYKRFVPGLGVAHGEDHTWAVLTEVAVREMRILHAKGQATSKELSQRFGVTSGTINDVLRRRTWKHLTA